ncbi:hypothetical protein HZU72_14245 [Halomonas sp. QX-2]|uniref:Uncharacterized protein n=1 Tax=Vreelandella sedimenti TaxID=2729618 RepID=A0A7Z0N9C4_9GAMM|nr:hypothetical protein [Halomonas sedimenti]NYT73579.1 hypothetical protein [Halomonas sedimenti]|tara:strand:+ start:22019 stop:22615 length:597 start_codon:yes stop_codon:yes gene_type:complete
MIDQGNQPSPGAPAQPNHSTESLKQQGRDTAHEVGEAAQHQAEGYFNQQRDNAAEQSHKLTGVLQKMADEFDNQQQPFFSKQARKFADTTERFSHNLRDKDFRNVCDEAQSLSRREPALFIGGVIAAGFLAARFLRSSGQHSHQRYTNATDEHSTGLPMQENVPAGQASPVSQASSLSGSSVPSNRAIGSAGRENGMP